MGGRSENNFVSGSKRYTPFIFTKTAFDRSGAHIRFGSLPKNSLSAEIIFVSTNFPDRIEFKSIEIIWDLKGGIDGSRVRYSVGKTVVAKLDISGDSILGLSSGDMPISTINVGSGLIVTVGIRLFFLYEHAANVMAMNTMFNNTRFFLISLSRFSNKSKE